MKKIFLFLIAIILIIPSISFATSGACSSHGGVNCLAGATYDGKVTCNDGWVNSSVYFSSTQECNTQEADIREIDYKINRIDSQISQLEISRDQAVINQREFLAKIGALRTDGNAQGGLDAVSQKYQSQIDLLNIDKNYLNKLKKSLQDELRQIKELSNKQQPTEEVSGLSDDKIKEISENLKKLNEEYFGDASYQESCTSQYGPKSIWNGVKNDDGTFYCKCVDGYVLGENKQCITLSSWCSKKYGPNTKISDGKCTCSNNYYYDGESKTCKKDNKTVEASQVATTEPPTVTENKEPINTLDWDKKITNPEPKIKWYQKIFNWFKRN